MTKNADRDLDCDKEGENRMRCNMNNMNQELIVHITSHPVLTSFITI